MTRSTTVAGLLKKDVSEFLDLKTSGVQGSFNGIEEKASVFNNIQKNSSLTIQVDREWMQEVNQRFAFYEGLVQKLLEEGKKS